MQEQALGAIRVQQEIVDEYRRLVLDRAEENVFPRVIVFPLIPVQNRAECAAIVAEAAVGGARPLVDAESAANRIIADVPGLNDDEILAMMGVRPMPIRRHLAADPSVVEGERAEMLHQQDDGIALALVRAERPRGHYSRPLEPEGQAVAIEPRREQTVAHRPSTELEIVHRMAHRLSPRGLWRVGQHGRRL